MSCENALVHGGDIYTDRGLPPGVRLCDFSANLNPLGMPPAVREAAAAAVSASEAYPDPLCRELRAALAAQSGVPAERIVCGNGAADLIYRLVWAVKPASGLVQAPSFAEYALALQNTGAEVRYAPLPSDFRPGEELPRAVGAGTGVVFFCNPNNPTGISAPRGYVRALAEKCRAAGALLLVDECFLDFIEGGEEKSAVPLLAEYENLLVLKAFTKMYAMAGLRLGYLLCGSDAVAEKVSHSGQAWSVSTPAQAAGLAALGIPDYPARTRALLAEERPFLADALRECGAEVFPSEANYLFFRWPDEHLPEKLLRRGFLIRSCGNYPGLDGRYNRIAVRTREENAAFAAALLDITRKGD